MNYPVISLFSGAMGLDLGLIKSGLSVKVSQDIEPSCRETMKANGHPHLIGDIRTLIQQDPMCRFLTNYRQNSPSSSAAKQ
jgi:DNA (cytosine-5)-methyltransferase 1